MSPSSTAPETPRAEPAEPQDGPRFVETILDHIDSQLAAIWPPRAKERFLLETHQAWVAAAQRRQARVVHFEDMDDHLRIIAGISARLREVSRV